MALGASLLPAVPAVAADVPTSITATKRVADVSPYCGNNGSPSITGGGGAPYEVRLRSGLRFHLSDVAPSWWRTPVGSNHVQNLNFYAQSWLYRVFLRAREHRDRAAMRRVLDLAVESYRVHPDNGRPGDIQWNEGANLYRERAVTCLYRLTRDPRLLPVIEATVRANLDPRRYYGPPHHAPHNHGLMATISLLVSATVLGRPRWRAAALARLGATVSRWVTPAGLGVEQSVAYHQLNAALWRTAVRVLALRPSPSDGAVVTRVRAAVARAQAALAHLVMPDGSVLPVGDGEPHRAAVTPAGRGVLLDRAAGLVTGRWERYSPDDFYALRFGPGRTAHGHGDHGQVVWWARGRAVVVDPGTASYVDRAAQRWQSSPEAHSSVRPVGGRWSPRAAMALTQSRTRGAVHRFTVSGAEWGRLQTRSVVVDSGRDALAVVDVTRGPQVQSWQLSPAWVPVSVSNDRHRVTLVDRTGAVLTMTTSGRVRSVARGRQGLAGGWVLRLDRSAVPAARVVVDGSGRLATRWRVALPVTG